MSFRSIHLLLVAALGLAPSLFAQSPSLRIAVRSSVERPFQGWGRAPIKEHGKIYYIMSLKSGDPGDGTVQKMVKPVDEARLRQVLVADLAKQGFREMLPTETPAILLTVVYGRGRLENPYIPADQVVDENGVLIVSGLDAVNNLVKGKSSVFQGNRQNAQLEKLFIRITAWDYPDQNGKKQKPKELWKTTVLIDEPEHRDLNQFIDKMLAAASVYFDKPTKEEEAISSTEFPEGYVRIGDTTEVSATAGKE